MSIIGWILFIVLAVMTYRTGKKKNWAEWKIYGGIALWFVGCLCTFMGDDTSSDSMSSFDYERSAETERSNSAPSWIQGKWVCKSPYGDMQIEIDGDYIREIPGDGTSYYSKYSIQDNKIMPHSGSGMYYPMDLASKRIGAGQGYYYERIK